MLQQISFHQGLPLNQQDDMAQKGKYTDQRHVSKSNSATDKVMEPLNKLLTDLVAHLKLLTPVGQSSHNAPQL